MTIPQLRHELNQWIIKNPRSKPDPTIIAKDLQTTVKCFERIKQATIKRQISDLLEERRKRKKKKQKMTPLSGFRTDRVGENCRGELQDGSTTPSVSGMDDIQSAKSSNRSSPILQKAISKLQSPLISSGSGAIESEFLTPIPSLSMSSFGGIESYLPAIREHVVAPLLYLDLLSAIGIKPTRGVLLYGPPGCGKSMLADVIAGYVNSLIMRIPGSKPLSFFKLACTELVSSAVGKTEEKMRQLFNDAKMASPSLVVLDDADSLFPKREAAQRAMETRIVSQLSSCFDSLSIPVPSDYNSGPTSTQPSSSATVPPVSGNTPGIPASSSSTISPISVTSSSSSVITPRVVIIATTSRPNTLEGALRRAGRFDREIDIGIPDERARETILKCVSKGIRVGPDVNFKAIAKATPGYVGSDLFDLVRQAATLTFKRMMGWSTGTSTGSTGHGDDSTKDEEDEGDDDQYLPSFGNTSSSSSSSSKPHQRSFVPLGLSMSHHIPGDSPDSSPQSHKRPKKRRYYDNSLNPEPPFNMRIKSVTLADFQHALTLIQPSAKREGFATVPDVTWEDVGALESVRKKLERTVMAPMVNPDEYKAFGLSTQSGVLLYGPPGCGKTLLAKALANCSGANFISVKGPELMNKYVGESEKAVRGVFERARASSPCIIFFDEIDSLCPRRGGEHDAAKRITNQFLTELDGIDSRKYSISVIGATNRPTDIDPAILRPSRFDKLIYVPLPSLSGRVDILKRLTRAVPLDSSVSLDTLGHMTDGFSGADLSGLVREAALCAAEERRAARIALLSADGKTKAGSTFFSSLKQLDKYNENVLSEESGYTGYTGYTGGEEEEERERSLHSSLPPSFGDASDSPSIRRSTAGTPLSSTFSQQSAAKSVPPLCVMMIHFTRAMEEVGASVSVEEEKEYLSMKEQMKKKRAGKRRKQDSLKSTSPPLSAPGMESSVDDIEEVEIEDVSDALPKSPSNKNAIGTKVSSEDFLMLFGEMVKMQEKIAKLERSRISK
ncbi:Uncharacterized AAA domain-containing protein C16E9.10c [Aduncisulcus paluster]|uniref:Uncharacterized AAA domain-containing protein C16E9.10c n=1 Tax=Aduncisulcus paluster TaxID=2918883 RepID=A0ABQ5KT05_9EUKA|nr:Uncharacterized AAA domain-containing protein C16E9.10c [Aduncisulcus paluster]